jgi:hypothetical protein
MPRIPTYTAERDLPAGPVAVEASVAAFTAPARALGAVASGIESAGNNVERAIYQVASAKKETKDRDDAFWAADQAEALTREFMDFQNKNAESETAAEDFMRFSKERIDAVSSGAPSAAASQRLRRMIGDNVTSNYGRALTVSTAVKESNRLVSLKTSAQNIAGMINESGGGGYNLAVTQPLIDSRIEAINKLPLSDDSKRRLRAAFHEELALATGPNEPEFALGLIDSSDFDESKKRILRNQIESYSKANNAAAIASFQIATEQEINAALKDGVPVKPPTDETLKAIYGDNWEARKVVIGEQYRVANTAINEWNKVREWSYPNQVAELSKSIQSGDLEVQRLLAQKLKQSKDEQEGPAVAGWVQRNVKPVSDAYAVAYAAPDGPTRTAKLTAAHALSLQYQGDPPLVVTGDERKKYLGLPPAMQHLLSEDRAKEWAAEVNAMKPPQLLDFLSTMAASYPDDNQRAIAWNDLVTIPKDGIKPEIQFAMAMPDRQVRERYLGAIQNKAATEKLNPETRKQFINAIEGNSSWKHFREAIDPTGDAQRSPMISQFRDAIVSYAETIGMSGSVQAPTAASKAVKDLIEGSFGFVKVNGQIVGIMRMRDDFGRKPARTDGDIAVIGRFLERAMKSVRMDDIATKNPDGTSVFPLSNLIGEKAAKEKQIANIIRSQGFFVMDPNGQGAQLFLRDEKTGTRFPLRDSKGQIYGVNFDGMVYDVSNWENMFRTTAGGGLVQQFPWRNMQR